MAAKYFFGIAYRYGRTVVQGASKKFQKLFEQEYKETRAAGVSSSGAFKSAAETINKQLKEFPKKGK